MNVLFPILQNSFLFLYHFIFFCIIGNCWISIQALTIRLFVINQWYVTNSWPDFSFSFRAFLWYRFHTMIITMAAIKRGTPTPTEIVMIARSERERHFLRLGKNHCQRNKYSKMPLFLYVWILVKKNPSKPFTWEVI